ncbi:LacI family DNA-binding transcriptional regulator [Glycomyces sp. NPDC048151]|uniref:LacI family DNA-binding transcriptional regulator n=1 Tax=Glycomyces sp. NPDC048151 TaxID=3364002 RepID=UPI00371BF248
MASRRVTVYDVAERAGVSIATVSFAFRRPSEVRERTREAVYAAARELGYVPSGSARGLAAGQTGTLGLHAFDLLIDRALEADAPAASPASTLDLTESAIPWERLDEEAVADPRAFPLYVDEIQRGFELECRRLGRPVLLSRSSDAVADVTETAGRVDGLAVFTSDPSAAAVAALTQVSKALPVVLFSLPPDADDTHHRILVDNRGGMAALVDHLVAVHGATGLEFIGGLTAADYGERFAAMREALLAQGLPAPDAPLDQSPLGRGRALEALRERIGERRLPRALVCASDQLALAVMDLLQAAGLRVPEDVIVTGFDGVLAGRLSRPTLTTVRQPMEAMGRLAARLLYEETLAPSPAPRTFRLGTRLYPRASCGCPET